MLRFLARPASARVVLRDGSIFPGVWEVFLRQDGKEDCYRAEVPYNRLVSAPIDDAMKLRVFLLCLVFPAAVASVAQADDDLVTPCYGPEKGELVLTTELAQLHERSCFAKCHTLSAYALLEYGLSDTWTLSLGSEQLRYRERSREAEDEEAETGRVQETDTFASVLMTLYPNETDEFYVELGGVSCRPSVGPLSHGVELAGYYAHEFRRVTGLVTFAWESPADQGRGNDPAGYIGVAVYTKLTENSGVTAEWDVSHASSTGQRYAAEFQLVYGYQFNEHMAVTVSATTLLHDSGRSRGEEPYDRTRHATSFGVGLRVRF